MNLHPKIVRAGTATAVLTALAVVSACSGGDDAGPQAAGGRTCGGWVTVEAVEAALGRPLDELEVDKRPATQEHEVWCVVLDGDDELLWLRSKVYGPRELQELELLVDDPESVEGPIEGSTIGPMYGGAGGQVLGLAELDSLGGGGRMLDVALHRPGPDVDGYEVVARLLEELEASATDGPPGNV